VSRRRPSRYRKKCQLFLGRDTAMEALKPELIKYQRKQNQSVAESWLLIAGLFASQLFFMGINQFISSSFLV
jgi:hypothetical protein